MALQLRGRLAQHPGPDLPASPAHDLLVQLPAGLERVGVGQLDSPATAEQRPEGEVRFAQGRADSLEAERDQRRVVPARSLVRQLDAVHPLPSRDRGRDGVDDGRHELGDRGRAQLVERLALAPDPVDGLRLPVRPRPVDGDDAAIFVPNDAVDVAVWPEPRYLAVAVDLAKLLAVVAVVLDEEEAAVGAEPLDQPVGRAALLAHLRAVAVQPELLEADDPVAVPLDPPVFERDPPARRELDDVGHRPTVKDEGLEVSSR